jgi:serine/threonine-protein kinase RsbW
MRTITLPGRLENLSKICDFVVQAANDAGLDDSAVYAVELAVDEACTNIIEHAYGGENKGDIRCTCNITPEGLTVILQDQGRPFKPESIPAPKVKARLADLKSRGAGLFLIRKMMDEVHFDFSAEGNSLTMTKKKS